METTIQIKKVKDSQLSSFNSENIQFGAVHSDHLLICHFENGEWQKPRIQPFENLSLSPMALCLHYGQTVFEGLKAYRLADGNINIFRIQKNYERINKSLQRMCMPELPEDIFIGGIAALVETDQAWVSSRSGESLYIRPLVIATEPRIGLRTSNEYMFIAICKPMSNFFAGSIKVKVETEFVRAVQGGAGFAKNGGNYGAAFYPSSLARSQGFDQVLWTDGRENKYIEESGMMNIMFIIDGIIVTPTLSGTILDGVTRDSILTLARDSGMMIEERQISYQELEEHFKDGKAVEAFGAGTAAVITPIEEITISGKAYNPNVSSQARLFELKQNLQDIRYGLREDVYNWNHIIYL